MTFDVGELPGRAKELKEAGIDAAYKAMSSGGGGISGSGYPALYKAAQDSMKDVEHVYDDFLDIPSPDDFKKYLSQIPSAMTYLTIDARSTDPVSGKNALSGYNTNLTLIGSDGDLLDPTVWTGEAAGSYKTYYGDKFIPTATAQYAACSVLVNAIAAEAAVWATLRDDLDRLSKDAIEKMKHSADRNPSGWSAALLIAGAVLAIPLTDGLSAAVLPAVGAGAVAAGVGIDLANEKGEPADEFNLDAGSPEKVISSLWTAINKIKTHTGTQENKIVTAMNGAVNKLNDKTFWQEFCLPMPAIADAPQHGIHDPDYGGYYG